MGGDLSEPGELRRPSLRPAPLSSKLGGVQSHAPLQTVTAATDRPPAGWRAQNVSIVSAAVLSPLQTERGETLVHQYIFSASGEQKGRDEPWLGQKDVFFYS